MNWKFQKIPKFSYFISYSTIPKGGGWKRILLRSCDIWDKGGEKIMHTLCTTLFIDVSLSYFQFMRFCIFFVFRRNWLNFLVTIFAFIGKQLKQNLQKSRYIIFPNMCLILFKTTCIFCTRMAAMHHSSNKSELILAYKIVCWVLK